MKSIKLSEIIGKDIKFVKSGSEIMYLYELDKYCKQILGKSIDFKGVSLIKELYNSEYYYYVYRHGVSLGYEPDKVEFADLTEIERKFFNYDLGGIVFEKKSADEWVYDYNTDRNANLILNYYNRSAGYVSLYAYMVILAIKDKKPVPKLVLNNSSPKQEEMEYLDILILQNFGNKLLKDKVDVHFSKETVTQPEWEAYVMYYRQLGYMQTDVSVNEKMKYVKKNFKVGDVVLLYSTEKAVKSKSIRKLTSCFPAVIRDIKGVNIMLDYYPIVATKLTKQIVLRQLEENYGKDMIYTYEDSIKFPTCSKSFSLYSGGVDYLMHFEDEFILTPFDGTDTFEQYLLDKNGVEGRYELGTLDTIYAVFEDRGVDYNEERFLKYFGKKKPVYDEIRGI